jgi:hypothetical protein
MSPKNWTECPQCEKMANQARNKQIQTAEASYGKVPQGKFLELIGPAYETVKLEETLRENYEFYFKDNILHVRYCCSCDKCGFKFEYNKDIDIWKRPR